MRTASRLILGAILALSAAGAPARAEPPAADPKTPPKAADKKEKKVKKVKKAPNGRIDALMRRQLDRKIAENAGILGAMRSQPIGNVFGGPGLRATSPAFRAADAAFERADWATANAKYAEGEPFKAIGLGGISAAAVRYGETCEALELRDCALEAAKVQRDRHGGLGGMGIIGASGVGVGGRQRERDPRSRLERALPDTLRALARARRAWRDGDLTEATAQYERAWERDPRCPGDRCPAYLMREIGAAWARGERHVKAVEALEGYLKRAPKAHDRSAVVALITTAKGAEAAAKSAAEADLDARRLRLPTASAKAPWLTLGPTPEVVFRGLRFGGPTGIARMHRGKFAQWWGATAGGAAQGPLALPDAPAWLAVGHDGAIYHATAAGALHRAPSVEAALRPSPRVATLPGVKAWKVAGTTVVAVTDRTVRVSPDGGRTFGTYTHPEAIGEVFVRADGVVVFGDAKGAWVSDDAGKRWTHTPLGDMRHLHQDGQRIYRRAAGPETYGFREQRPSCAQGELTADLKWVVPGEREYGREGSGWEVVFSLGEHARAPIRLADGRGRPARTEGADAVAEVERCRQDPAAYFASRGGGAGGLGGMGGRCSGLDCLLRPALPAAPVDFGLLGDARRVDATEKRPAAVALLARDHDRLSTRRLRGTPIAAALASAGTLLRVDAAGARPIPPPEGCALRWVTAIGGLGLGACEGEPRQIVLLDSEGRAVERFAVPGPLQAAMLGPDGTIVVQIRTAGSPVAAVRRPFALGAPDAWRIAEVAAAEAWRPAVDGGAIALVPGSVAAPRFRAGSASVDGKWTSGWTSSTLKPIEACHARAFAADPTLRGDLELIFDLKEGTPRSTSVTNGLRGLATGALVDCILDATRDAYHRRETGVARYPLHFTADLQSYRLVLSTPDGAARKVTEDITFERPPEQIEVQADGTVQVTHMTYPRQTCVVPKSGAPLCPRTK